MSRFRLFGVSMVAATLVAGGTGGLAVFAHGSGRHAAAGAPIMGSELMRSVPTFLGYYDGHKDTYINTDVSNKAQATAMHINYSSAIGKLHGLPAIYLVQGRHVPQQIAVFGSEAGESDYSPLWQEVIVTFKAGVKPVLLTSDNQVNALAKKGKLTAKTMSTVLNCPILKVSK